MWRQVRVENRSAKKATAVPQSAGANPRKGSHLANVSHGLPSRECEESGSFPAEREKTPNSPARRERPSRRARDATRAEEILDAVRLSDHALQDDELGTTLLVVNHDTRIADRDGVQTSC